MFEMLPPVTRPRIFVVARLGVSLRKFAMLLVGTLKSPKLWNRFAPPPGLVPPVMSYWTFPEESVWGGLTRVLSPDDVMGVWADEVKQANSETSEKASVRKGINRRCSAWCCFNGEPSLGTGASPSRHSLPDGPLIRGTPVP